MCNCLSFYSVASVLLKTVHLLMTEAANKTPNFLRNPPRLPLARAPSATLAVVIRLVRARAVPTPWLAALARRRAIGRVRLWAWPPLRTCCRWAVGADSEAKCSGVRWWSRRRFLQHGTAGMSINSLLFTQVVEPPTFYRRCAALLAS